MYQAIVSAHSDKRAVGSPGQADGLIEKCDEPLAEEGCPLSFSGILCMICETVFVRSAGFMQQDSANGATTTREETVDILSLIHI